MERKYLKLNDVIAYKSAFHLANYIWEIVISWDNFSKFTVGEQLIRAVDSISANIAEGFGRYHKKDKIKFYRYSFGSLKETFDWCAKAKIRHLLMNQQYDCVMQELQKLPRQINFLIAWTNNKLRE